MAIYCFEKQTHGSSVNALKEKRKKRRRKNERKLKVVNFISKVDR